MCRILLSFSRTTLLFFTIVYIPFNLFAASVDSSIEKPVDKSIDIGDEFFDDKIPLILTTSRLNKTLAESPASVSIIDRQMIEASGARKISELFRMVPGFIVGSYNATSPVVTYHGLGRRFQHQMQLLVDGRSVFIPSFGGIPWTNLPLQLEDIERIEINRGPNAVTYGANAFLASINIITRHAAEDYGFGYSLTKSLDQDSDIADGYLRLGNQHQNIDWRLSLGSQTDDGFVDGPTSRHFDSRDVKKVNFRTDFQPALNQSWTLQLGINRTMAGRGDATISDGEVQVHEDDILRTEKVVNSFQSLRWESIKDSYTNQFLITHTNQDVTDHYETLPFTFGGIPEVSGTINLDRESDRIDVEAFHNREINSSFRFVVGGSLREDKVKSFYIFNDNSFHDLSVKRLHGNIEWRPSDNWLVDIGTVVEESELTDREVSPRLSLIHNLNKQHSLRLVHSIARRNPVMYEVMGKSIFTAQTPFLGNIPIPVKVWNGNPSFIPEKNTSIELGLHSEYAASGLSTDIKIFEYKITNQLHAINPTEFNTVLNTDIPFESVDNSGFTRVNGLDFLLNFAPPTQPYRIYSGFSVTDASSRYSDVESSFPASTAYLAGYYNLNSQHTLSASYNYISELDWLDTSQITPITRKLDLRYQFAIDKPTELKFEIVAQNVLDDFADYRDEQTQQTIVFIRFSGSL